jgi:hypothetical protein
MRNRSPELDRVATFQYCFGNLYVAGFVRRIRAPLIPPIAMQHLKFHVRDAVIARISDINNVRPPTNVEPARTGDSDSRRLSMKAEIMQKRATTWTLYILVAVLAVTGIVMVVLRALSLALN